MTRYTKTPRLLCRQEQESDVFLSHPSGAQRGLPDVALPNARCAPTNPFTHILYLPPLRRRKGPTKGQETHTQTYVRSHACTRAAGCSCVCVFSLITYTTSKYWFPLNYVHLATFHTERSCSAKTRMGETQPSPATAGISPLPPSRRKIRESPSICFLSMYALWNGRGATENHLLPPVPRVIHLYTSHICLRPSTKLSETTGGVQKTPTIPCHEHHIICTR